MIHIPDIPEGVMLPGALLPVESEKCAGSFRYMTRLGIEGIEAQERYCAHFCGPGCCYMCRQIMLSMRSKHVAKDRIPILLDADGDITTVDWKMPATLLKRTIYLKTTSKE